MMSQCDPLDTAGLKSQRGMTCQRYSISWWWEEDRQEP